MPLSFPALYPWERGITEEETIHYASQMHVVVLGHYVNVRQHDPLHTSFIWDTYPIPDAVEPSTNLLVLTDVHTFHPFECCGLFEPSTASVIRSIPSALRDQVYAFQIIRYPDVSETSWEHVALTRLYTHKPGTPEAPEASRWAIDIL